MAFYPPSWVPNLPGTIDYIPVTHAIHRVDGIVTPASSAHSASELEHQLRSSGAKALFTCAPLLSTALKAASAVGIPKKYIFLLPLPETPSEESFQTIEDLIAEGKTLPPLELSAWVPGQGKRQVAYLCYSSGTSGLPKAVMISHYNVIACTLMIHTFESITRAQDNIDTQVALGLLPFSHIYGLVVIAHIAQYRGDEIIVLQRFQLDQLLVAIQKFRIEQLSVVPPIIVQILSNQDKCQKYNLDSVRLVFSGAAPLGGETIQKLLELYPKWRISQGYGTFHHHHYFFKTNRSGLTEASPSVFHTSEADPVLGSSGSLLPGAKVKIIDQHGSEVTSYETPGELYVQAPNVVLGYLHNEKANAETFVHRDDGRWLRTGDEVLVRKSPCGNDHFFIVDRIKELIKVKGHQVAPAELEAHLLDHPYVDDCAVIGILDERAGEVPLAFIVKSKKTNGLKEEDVSAGCHTEESEWEDIEEGFEGADQGEETSCEALSNENPHVQIATLPMLNGKVYAAFDPALLQTLLRNKTASFEPFVFDYAKKTFALKQETFAKVKVPGVYDEFTEAIHASFQVRHLQQMNVHFLGSIAAKLNCATIRADSTNTGKETVGNGRLHVENLYLWCRDVMSLATTRSLYGDTDPFNRDPSLIDDMWLFEESVPYFLLSLFPSITMPKAYKARSTLQNIACKWYAQGHDIHDPSVSALVRNRAGALRKNGLTGYEIGKFEVILPNVATLNAVPTFYWLLLYILDRPDLLARIRAEAENAAVVEDSNGKRSATFNIVDFEEKMPLLVSCYRETLRLVNQTLSMRRILQDTSVTTPEGTTYILKKDTDLQLPAGVAHYEDSVWGADVNVFNPKRFLPTSKGSAEDERKRKAAYIPFGGGRHLCPGRNLAFAEIIGFASALLLGFEIEAVGMGFGDVKKLGPQLAGGTVRPERYGAGLGAEIAMRRGWEDVEWRFEC
ncbi:cytochrome P450 monooxygenase 8B1 [Fusarium phyllophilum]|uniref:Cytochrome P450 monooxygenase 8B1 n=1 Tax=Fusarium phyllophilum TaxID=47803 RepID=A0A8H5MQT5_9HYPO|nr:cytochrome P450 monooxygenase 8B1 [Fusarium phyllophilum]